MLLGSAISWSSKWQSVVALSTSKAEYIVLSHAVREAIWLHNLISQVTNSKLPLVTLFCDNQSAINLAENDKFLGCYANAVIRSDDDAAEGEHPAIAH